MGRTFIFSDWAQGALSHCLLILSPQKATFYPQIPLKSHKSVGSRKAAQSIGVPGKPEKTLITSKVTTSFSDPPFTPMAYTSFSRPTDFF
jgi:hypothetical protein